MRQVAVFVHHVNKTFNTANQAVSSSNWTGMKRRQTNVGETMLVILDSATDADAVQATDQIAELYKGLGYKPNTRVGSTNE